MAANSLAQRVGDSSPESQQLRRSTLAVVALASLLLALTILRSQDAFRRVQGLYQAPKVVSTAEFKRLAISDSFNKFYEDNRFRRLQIASTPVANSTLTVVRPRGTKQYVRFLVAGNVLLPAISPSNDSPLPVRGMLRKSTALRSKTSSIRSTFGADAKILPYLFATNERPSALNAGLLVATPLFCVVASVGALLALARLRRRAVRLKTKTSENHTSTYERFHDVAQTSVGNTATGRGVVALQTAEGLSGVEVDRAIWVYADGPVGSRKVHVHTDLGEMVSFPVENPAREDEVVGFVRTRNPLTYIGLDPTVDRMWTSHRSAFIDAFREVAGRPTGTPTSADVLAVAAQRRAGEIQTSPASAPQPSLSGPAKKLVLISLASTALLVPLAVLPANRLNPIKRVRTFPLSWTARDKPLVEFVEKSRGRAFKHPVKVDLLTTAEYDRTAGNLRETERYTCTFDARCAKDDESLDTRREVFELLGLRPGGDSEDLRTSGAFYSQIEKRIYVRGKSLTPYLRSVMVHELTHAWQDQHFNLAARDRGINTDDAWLAWLALVEGDANYVREQYRQTQPADPEEGNLADDPPSSFQYLDLVGFEFPYAAGPSYVKLLRQKGGVEALDQRFKVLPNSVQEILDGKHRKSIGKVSSPTNEGETVIYGEYLDVFRYYVLLADQQRVSFEDLAANWRGGVVQLISFEGNRCARVILGVDKDAPEENWPPLPALLTDPTKGLPRVQADSDSGVSIISASNCLPIPESAERTGDLEAVDQLLDTWWNMTQYAVDLSTTISADRLRAKADVAKG
jgi:hypothetical protein